MSVSTRAGSPSLVFQCDKKTCGASVIMPGDSGRFRAPLGWVRIQIHGPLKIITYDCCNAKHAADIFPKQLTASYR